MQEPRFIKNFSWNISIWGHVLSVFLEHSFPDLHHEILFRVYFRSVTAVVDSVLAEQDDGQHSLFYMYMCTHVYTYIYTETRLSLCIYMYIHIYTQRQSCLCVYICIYMCTHIHVKQRMLPIILFCKDWVNHCSYWSKIHSEKDFMVKIRKTVL